MIIERPAFNIKWPEVSEAELSELEIIEDNGIYITILKPKRLSKPLRKLYQNTPVSEEIFRRFGEFRFQYTVDLEPHGTAGGHYHNEKAEIFCPHEEIQLLLKHIGSEEQTTINMNRGDENTYAEFLIPPRVAHLVLNPNGFKATYTVLSNVPEKRAIESGDVKYFDLG